MEKFKLSKPIMINGEQVSELPFDFDSMTATDLTKAGAAAKAANIPILIAPLDTDYHVYLFAQAVNCADRNIDIADVLRMSARDALRATGLARNFFFVDSEDLSTEESSDESSPILQ